MMKNAEKESAVRLGLGAKVLVVLTLVIVSTALLSGWVYNRLVTRYTIDTQIAEADHLTRAACLAAAGPLAQQDAPALKSLADKLMGHPRLLYISIVDAQQNELAFTSRISAGRCVGQLHRNNSPELYATQAVGDCILVTRPVVDDQADSKAIVGAVRLAMDMHEAIARLHQANLTMLLLGCGFVLLAVPISDFLLGRLLIRPARSLLRATQRLAQGDLSARAPDGRTDELGLVARGFNEMAARLEAQHQELHQANERLEIEVARRTAELHLANQRLRLQVEDNEEFVRAVSHDLNAPLRNIAGLTSMLILKWSAELPDVVLARLERIRANAQSETELISELLELSRIRSCPQRRVPVDMGKLIEQIRASLEYDLKANSITLEVAEGLPTLRVERTRIRQVFMNLIDNAVKYMPAERADGKISISYELAGGEHIFRIADNGPGIDPEDQRKIFTVFRRAGNHADVPGKGVGLTTVRTIVQSHDGRVWVHSELGQGANFFVALPVASTHVTGEILAQSEENAAVAEAAVVSGS